MKKEEKLNDCFSEPTIIGFPDEEYIQTVSDCILSEPKFVLNSTNPEFLYSTSQMKSMFMLGYYTRKKEAYIKRELAKKQKQSKMLRPSYSMLRGMEIGDRLQFPYEDWKAIRTTASKLKKDFGATYHVKKLAPNGEVGKIEVIRLS